MMSVNMIVLGWASDKIPRDDELAPNVAKYRDLVWKYWLSEVASTEEFVGSTWTFTTRYMWVRVILLRFWSKIIPVHLGGSRAQEALGWSICHMMIGSYGDGRLTSSQLHRLCDALDRAFDLDGDPESRPFFGPSACGKPRAINEFSPERLSGLCNA